MYFVENKEFVDAFKKHSAAKSVHHGFMGGLLEHTLSVTDMCQYFAEHYPMIHRDLLITAALFHDMGKIQEISDLTASFSGTFTLAHAAWKMRQHRFLISRQN